MKLKFNKTDEWLKDISNRNTIDSDDENFIKYLLIKLKMPYKIVGGLVYLDNKGDIISINKFSKTLLDLLTQKGIL